MDPGFTGTTGSLFGGASGRSRKSAAFCHRVGAQTLAFEGSGQGRDALRVVPQGSVLW